MTRTCTTSSVTPGSVSTTSGGAPFTLIAPEPRVVSRGTRLATSESVNPRTYRDRKSTRLNSSHVEISYAVFCLKKKKKIKKKDIKTIMKYKTYRIQHSC